MQRMPKLLLMPLLLLTGCAVKSTPVAVSCPAPPLIPLALTLPVSTEPSLNVRIEHLLKEYEQALMKAQRRP